MKNIYLVFLFSFFILSCNNWHKPNKENLKLGTKKNFIDSIQSTNEIEKLMTSIHGTFYHFKIYDTVKVVEKEYQKFADSIKVKAIVKADFDNNGLTDVLVTAQEDERMGIYCIMDLGKRKYELISISRYDKDLFSLATVEMYKDIPIICYFSMDSYFKMINNSNGYRQQVENKTLIKQKLIYKFGNFIEYHEKSLVGKIEKIEFNTKRCFGDCPVYKLCINKDKSAIYKAEENIKSNGKIIKGFYKTTLDDVHFNQLVELLNYINFIKLDNEYNVNGSDFQTCYIQITYDGGKIKKIADYGYSGTFGLAWAYALLDKLRDNQKWE